MNTVECTPNIVNSFEIENDGHALHINLKTSGEANIPALKKKSFSLSLTKKDVEILKAALYTDIEKAGHIIDGDDISSIVTEKIIYHIGIVHDNTEVMVFVSLNTHLETLRNVCAIYGARDIIAFYEKLKEECERFE